MQEPELGKMKETRRQSWGWLIVLLFALFIIWVVYIGYQTQTVDSMPTNMENMNSNEMEGTPPETSSEMPSNMSGMNHP